MITIYKEEHILEKDPRLYIFLKQKNLMTQYLRGLNGIHPREVQYDYWIRNLSNPQEIFSSFSWSTYNSIYPEDNLSLMGWYNYYIEFDKIYKDLPKNITFKLIKVI